MVTATATRASALANRGWKTARSTRTTPARTTTSGQRSKARMRRLAGTHPKLIRNAISPAAMSRSGASRPPGPPPRRGGHPNLGPQVDGEGLGCVPTRPRF